MDLSLWTASFGRGYGPDLSQTTDWISQTTDWMSPPPHFSQPAPVPRHSRQPYRDGFVPCSQQQLPLYSTEKLGYQIKEE